MNHIKKILKERFWLFLIAGLFSVFTSLLFHRQALEYLGGYPSDLPAHITQAVVQDHYNYSLIFIFMRWAWLLSHKRVFSVAILEGLLIGLTMICTAIVIEKLYHAGKWICIGISFFLLFLTSIYVPWLSPWYYRGSIIAQPWHNITYNAMRPAAVLTMLFFSRLFKTYREEKRISAKNWLLTCLLLIITTMCKPSFLMAFAPALLVFILIDFFGRRNSFKNEFLLGCVVLPAMIVLPFQAGVLFGGENGFMVAPSIFFFGEGWLVLFLKFVTALPLPVMVYIHNRHSLSGGAGIAAWGHFFALMEAMFFMEQGPRMTHGNFLWGIYIMGYILFLYACSMFFRNLREAKEAGGMTVGRRAYFAAGFVLMGLHLFCGLRYFTLICQGKHFYV